MSQSEVFPWNVLYSLNSERIYTRSARTYEGARIIQESIIRKDNPLWTAVVRNRRDN